MVNPKFSILDPLARCQDLAAQFGVSRNTITRWTKTRYGSTFRDFRALLMASFILSRQPGETVSAFCQRTGIPPATFYYWQRKTRQQGNGALLGAKESSYE